MLLIFCSLTRCVKLAFYFCSMKYFIDRELTPSPRSRRTKGNGLVYMTFETSIFNLESYKPESRILKIVLDRDSGRYNATIFLESGKDRREVPGPPALSNESIAAIAAFAGNNALMSLTMEDLYEDSFVDDCAWALEVFAGGRHLKLKGTGAYFADGEIVLHTDKDGSSPSVKTGFSTLTDDIKKSLD